jgi:PAS domain S-box-containing protein
MQDSMASARFRLRSRFRVSTALALGLSLIMLLAMLFGFLLLGRISLRMHEDVINRNRLLAVTIANDIRTYLDGYALSLGLLDEVSFRNQAGVDGIKKRYPAFTSVYTVNGFGLVEFASSGSTEKDYDVSQRDFFRMTLDKSGTYLSPAFIAAGDYLPTVVLAVPIQNGVAVGYLNLAALSGYLMQLPVQETESVAVIDSVGCFVAHTDLVRVTLRDTVALESWFENVTDGEADSKVVASSDGSTDLVCWAPVEFSSGWITMISSSTQQAFSFVRDIGTVMGGSIAGISSLAILFTLLVLFVFDRDVRKLRFHTQAIAQGRYEKLHAYNGFRDLEPLADDFRLVMQAVKERESKIKENEKRLERLLDFIPVPVIILDARGIVTLVNKALSDLVGWSMHELKNMDDWWQLVYPVGSYRATVRTGWEKDLATLRSGLPVEHPFDGRITCKDGSERIVIGSPAIIGESIVSTFIDVSSSREYEAKIAASLAEKEILLKEIHHRVKNNLQLIISLLTLKSSTVPGQNEAFSDSIDRIMVMATIHELLYESKNFAHINLGEYITTIVEWLLSAHAYGDVFPRLKLDLLDIELAMDAAIPCGLIINELFSNSIKYAFDASSVSPVIAVGVSSSADNYITMSISDNGRGLPASIDPGTADTLGLQLIVSLTSQLHGTWSLVREGGTAWSIRFPG